jgi:hypothetical protein
MERCAMAWESRHPTFVAVGILGVMLNTMCPAAAATLSVTDLGDNGAPGQLRTLINAAAPGDTVVIPAGTITLTGVANEDANASGDLDITKDLTIQGAGAVATVIDGGGIDRVLHILVGTTVTISGVTITGGRIVTATGLTGGGVSNSGTLTVTGSAISGNSSNFGG